MNVFPTPAVRPTVLTASNCLMTTNVSASQVSQVGDVRTGSAYVSLSLVRTVEPVQFPAALHKDTPAHVSLVILGPTVKEACPVESSPATMEAAVHLQQGAHVALACQVLVGPSVSIAVMKAAPPSPAGMEACAPKRPASPSSTASVLVAGQVNGASRAAGLLIPQQVHAPWRTVTAKPMMVFATRSATHSRVAGMAATVL